MNIKKKLVVLLASCVFTVCVPIKAASFTHTVFIEPSDGFETFIAAAIVKKQVPIVVTKNRADAEFVIHAVVIGKEESGLSKVARCAFAYCIGVNGTQTATVELIDSKQQVVWAYNVRKGGSSNFQSSAEAVAKHLKEFIRTGH
jgi:hypothetical protein